MHPLHELRGRSAALTSAFLLSLATISCLAGAALAASTSEVATNPPSLDRWRSPRLHVWADGWKGVQDEGVSLEPEHIFDLEVQAGQAVTFHWSGKPKSGQASIHANRWALDIEDISDETPRLDPNDLAHWSAWSATETSATVGPFAAGEEHVFSVEVRDSLGFITLVTVRLVVRG